MDSSHLADENRSEMQGEIHQGHDFESGMLMRVRAWTDVMGWLRLVRILRLSASPPAIGLVAAVYSVWNFAVVRFAPPGVIVMKSQYGDVSSLPRDLEALLLTVNPGSWWIMPGQQTGGLWLLVISWSLLIWTPVILILSRQGALLAADRSLESLPTVGSRSLRRTPSAWIASIVPSVCVLGFCFVILVSGWISRLDWLAIPMSVVICLATIPAGILLFGGCFAVPLSFAAIANESQPDPLDSLSRGYEAIYRRPLHLLIYLFVAFVLVTVAWAIAMGVAEFSAAVMEGTLSLAGVHPESIGRPYRLIFHLPIIVAITTLWGMIGGVYLLSRESTGEQQVEDLWSPLTHADPPLPVPESVPDSVAAPSVETTSAEA
ncbi:hypothetical protein [Rubripirellula amarantea]|uniref:hypothetical protein n=1 Tax=Rubripirellula amarantea TaxID=2527999 RepID=UPI0011B395D9|nr:hypothetical protein [Rubripirellula amarantea]